MPSDHWGFMAKEQLEQEGMLTDSRDAKVTWQQIANSHSNTLSLLWLSVVHLLHQTHQAFVA